VRFPRATYFPLHRQAKIFGRFGVELSDQTMGGWMGQCAHLLDPLYQKLKGFVLSSKVVGTDDTPVKVLDRSLPQTRKGRIWPYVGDRDHPAIIYDYTPTRERAGPEEFLKGFRGHLQADAYVVYDSFFTDPARGMVEVGCWAHARRHFHNALENDPARMGGVLAMIAHLYEVEKVSRRNGLRGEALRLVREQDARSTASVPADNPRAGAAQERSGTSDCVLAEELGCADLLLLRRRSAHRQQCHRTLAAR
jgi:transposase